MNYSIKKVLNFSIFHLIIISLLVYFWKWIDPALIDFKQQPVFLFDLKFLKDYLVLPGGLAEYLSLFISQFFHFTIPGTVIFILVFYLIILLTGKLLSIFFPMDYVFVLQFFPVLFLVHLHSQYSYTLKPDIIIIISVSLSLVYNYYVGKGNLFKIFLFITCAAFLVLLFGGISLIIFSLLVILIEIKKRNKKFSPVIAAFVVIAFLLPFLVGLYTPYMNTEKAFFDILIPEKNYSPVITLYALFIFYPVIILSGVILFRKVLVSSLIPDTYKWKMLITAIVQTAIPIIFLLVTLKFSYNKYDKALIELEYFADKEDWQSVLKAGEMLPPENRLVLFHLNRALYNTDRLMEDLFSYNQLWGQDGMILTRYYNSKILMPISDYYFDLGFIKESLHWAYEALTKYELAPIVLKRIALSNLILGEYKISEKFLTILSKSAIHRKWANKYLNYINNKDLIESDPVIQKKKDLMPKRDYYANNNEPEINLINLLEDNPKNKMAFEYLIANSLLRHDIGNVIKNLHYLSELNYREIPKHIEEAILLYAIFQKEEDIQLKPYQISNITTEHFRRYNSILYNKHKNDIRAAKIDLSKYFRNTFWYYLHYVSPITTKREIKERS